MNRKVRILIVLIVAGIGAGIAYWWQSSEKDTGQVSELVLYGNVDIREVRLAFNGSEHVAAIRVDEGDQVQAGQLLASLHAASLQAAWDAPKPMLRRRRPRRTRLP